MTITQAEPTTSRRTKSGKFAWVFNHGEWKVIDNPFFEEGEPLQTGSEDQTFPEDWGYYVFRPYSDHHLYFDLYVSEHKDDHPYLMKVLVPGKEDLIFMPDAPSLVELYDKFSLIFGVKPMDD